MMKQRCALLILSTIAAMVSSAAPMAATNALTSVEKDADANARTLASSAWTDGRAPHPEADYLIARTETIRTPSPALVFGGNSLQLGTSSAKVNFAQKQGSLTFPRDGLYLRNVQWTHWAGGEVGVINGRVTVLAPSNKPVVFVNSVQNNNTGYEFTGDWHCGKGCGVVLKTVSPYDQVHRLILSGDLSDYRGELTVQDGAELVLAGLPFGGVLKVDGANAPALLSGPEIPSETSLNALELKSGARLAVRIRQRPDGELVCGGWRVTGRLTVSGRTEIVVPRALYALSLTSERRFPVLTLAASADGTLSVSDFTIRFASSPLHACDARLAVSSDAQTGERSLDMILAAMPDADGVVHYEDYGAKGDGVTDDMDAFVAAHAAANEVGVPVRARDGAVYRIVGRSKRAEIRTDVNFGTARIVIDDRDLDDVARNKHLFRVAPNRAPVSLAGCDRIVKGRHTLGIPLPGRCLVEAVNDKKKQFIRTGSNQNSGSSQQEVFLASADGTLDRDIPMRWDFETVTSLTAYPIDEEPLSLRGGVFETIANQAESRYTYYLRGFSVERANVRIAGMRHEVSGEGATGAPYGGFIDALHAVHLEIADCVFTGHKTYRTEYSSSGNPVSMGSYDVRANRSIDVRLKNCRQTNDIDDTAYWGVFTSNFCKLLAFEGCRLSRFDAHQGVADVVIRNSVLGHMAIKLVGQGTALIENSEIRSRTLVELRSDYGSPWDGEIIVRNCRLCPQNLKSTGGKVCIINANNNSQNDYGYPCQLPFRLVVDGLYLDDVPYFSNYRGPWIFENFNSSRTSDAFVERFPYPVTERVVMSNVTTASGKPFDICTNTWVFRNLLLDDTLPTDIVCSLDEPVIRWNWTNTTVSADISAFDASVIRDGRMVLTVRDAAGTAVVERECAVTGPCRLDFDIDLPKAGCNYRYELTAYDGERMLSFAQGARERAFYAGPAETTDWFAASPEGGVRGGAWAAAPDVVGHEYVVHGSVGFRPDDPHGSPDRTMRVSADYAVDELAASEAYAPPAGAAILACEGGAAPCWKVASTDRFGERRWVELAGHCPEAGKTYSVEISIDCSVNPPRARYAVGGAGGGSRVTLADAEGTSWFPAKCSSSQVVSEVCLEGAGRVKSLAGRISGAAVAKTGGVLYDDLNAALAAGAANGTSVTLLVSVGFVPDRETGGVTIDMAGHRLKWKDGNGLALACDAASGAFRVVRMPGGRPANGLPSYTSYLLGLDATDPASKPRATLTLDGTSVSLALEVEPPAGRGAQLTYRVEWSETPDFRKSEFSPPQQSPSFTLPYTASSRFYRLLIDCPAE